MLGIIKQSDTRMDFRLCRVKGRRENIRMAQAMPQIGKGFGAIGGKLSGMDPDRTQQAHDTASRKILRFRVNY